DLPSRHQTLRTALDWSYQLLPPELQRFFVRLCVFRGGWTIEAAAAVCNVPSARDRLLSLCGGSPGVMGGGGGTTGGRVLGTLREFGAEQIAPAERIELRQRHLAYYLSLAEVAAPGWTGPDQATWIKRFEADHDNLRAALDWAACGGEMAAGLRLAVALGTFW